MIFLSCLVNQSRASGDINPSLSGRWEEFMLGERLKKEKKGGKAKRLQIERIYLKKLNEK